MSEAAVAESVAIAAVPERVGLARAFVAAVLGEPHPCSDLAVLLASELVTNSVRHSGSAVPGGLVTVAVAVGAGGLRLEVTDRSGDGALVLPPAAFADGDAECRQGWGSWTPAPHDEAPAAACSQREDRHRRCRERRAPRARTNAATTPLRPQIGRHRNDAADEKAQVTKGKSRRIYLVTALEDQLKAC